MVKKLIHKALSRFLSPQGELLMEGLNRYLDGEHEYIPYDLRQCYEEWREYGPWADRILIEAKYVEIMQKRAAGTIVKASVNGFIDTETDCIGVDPSTGSAMSQYQWKSITGDFQISPQSIQEALDDFDEPNSLDKEDNQLDAASLFRNGGAL